MHQLAEYVVGVALVAYGLRSPTPLVPAVAGAVIASHTAFTEGPLAAFRVIPRRIHRILDPLVVAVCLAGAVQPWISCESSTRLVVGGAALAVSLMWLNTSFVSRADRRHQAGTGSPTPELSTESPVDRSTAIGRQAGRAAGKALRAWRERHPS